MVLGVDGTAQEIKGEDEGTEKLGTGGVCVHCPTASQPVELKVLFFCLSVLSQV